MCEAADARLHTERLWGAGNQASSATAHASCYASVFADTYAKSVAMANIEAGCGYWRDKSRSTADVLAEVSSDLYAKEACELVERQDGLADASATGRARTRTRTV